MHLFEKRVDRTSVAVVREILLLLGLGSWHVHASFCTAQSNKNENNRNNNNNNNNNKHAKYETVITSSLISTTVYIKEDMRGSSHSYTHLDSWTPSILFIPPHIVSAACSFVTFKMYKFKVTRGFSAD